MMFDGMEFVSADSMFQTNEVIKSHTSLPSSPSHLFQPYPPQDFHGVLPSQFRKSMSFSGIGINSEMEMQIEDDMSDDGLPLGEKKRRLTMEQVRALEKSFELGNKLDTERKMQLARSLGLQPRQVAIWFQNRRARWKTKQLEKDYVVLKKKFEAVKAQNDQLQAHNKTLHSELLALKGRESTATRHIHLNLGPTRSEIKFQKIDQTVPDESLSNMFVAINDEQSGFWQWTEQQRFH